MPASPISLEMILAAAEAGEGVDWEFKSARGSVPGSLWEPDRFFLSKPGTLLVSKEQFRCGGVSECRNPALQQMFLMIGGGERAGSGVDKIRAGWLSRHWRPPLLRTQVRPDRVELLLPMVSLIPDGTIVALENRYGKTMIAGLPADALQALATIEIEGSTTNARLQELLDRHPSDITRLLQNLCNHGFLDSDNRRRWATYRLKGAGSEPGLFDPPVSPADSSHKAGNSSHLEGNSSHLGGDSSHLEGDSSHLGGDSSHLGGDTSHLGGNSHLDAKRNVGFPEAAKQVAASGKANPELMEKAILDLCRGRFLTVLELATLLNRYPPSLRNRHLTPMVAAGLLKLRFPRQGNRPDQAYTTAESNPPSSGSLPLS